MEEIPFSDSDEEKRIFSILDKGEELYTNFELKDLDILLYNKHYQDYFSQIDRRLSNIFSTIYSSKSLSDLIPPVTKTYVSDLMKLFKNLKYIFKGITLSTKRLVFDNITFFSEITRCSSDTEITQIFQEINDLYESLISDKYLKQILWSKNDNPFTLDFRVFNDVIQEKYIIKGNDYIYPVLVRYDELREFAIKLTEFIVNGTFYLPSSKDKRLLSEVRSKVKNLELSSECTIEDPVQLFSSVLSMPMRQFDVDTPRFFNDQTIKSLIESFTGFLENSLKTHNSDLFIHLRNIHQELWEWKHISDESNNQKNPLEEIVTILNGLKPYILTQSEGNIWMSQKDVKELQAHTEEAINSYKKANEQLINEARKYNEEKQQLIYTYEEAIRKSKEREKSLSIENERLKKENQLIKNEIEEVKSAYDKILQQDIKEEKPKKPTYEESEGELSQKKAEQVIQDYITKLDFANKSNVQLRKELQKVNAQVENLMSESQLLKSQIEDISKQSKALHENDIKDIDEWKAKYEELFIRFNDLTMEYSGQKSFPSVKQSNLQQELNAEEVESSEALKDQIKKLLIEKETISKSAKQKLQDFITEKENIQRKLRECEDKLLSYENRISVYENTPMVIERHTFVFDPLQTQPPKDIIRLIKSENIGLDLESYVYMFSGRKLDELTSLNSYGYYLLFKTLKEKFRVNTDTLNRVLKTLKGTLIYAFDTFLRQIVPENNRKFFFDLAEHYWGIGYG